MIIPKIEIIENDIDRRRLTGRVVLETGSIPENVNGLKIILSLRVRRDRSVDTYVLAQQTKKVKIKLAANDKHIETFEFIRPNGPITYRGVYLEIAHEISVVIDRPWAIDAKTSKEVEIKQAWPRHYGQFEQSMLDQNMSVSGERGMVIPVVRDYDNHEPSADEIEAHRNMSAPYIVRMRDIPLERWTKLRYGTVLLDIDPGYITPGDTVSFRIQGEIYRKLPIDLLSIELLHKEVVYVGKGKHRKSIQHEHTHVKKRLFTGDCPREGFYKIEDQVVCPHRQIYSWQSFANTKDKFLRGVDNASLMWILRCRVRVNRLLSWYIDQPVVVLPKIGN